MWNIQTNPNFASTSSHLHIRTTWSIYLEKNNHWLNHFLLSIPKKHVASLKATKLKWIFSTIFSRPLKHLRKTKKLLNINYYNIINPPKLQTPELCRPPHEVMTDQTGSLGPGGFGLVFFFSEWRVWSSKRPHDMNHEILIGKYRDPYIGLS